MYERQQHGFKTPFPPLFVPQGAVSLRLPQLQGHLRIFFETLFSMHTYMGCILFFPVGLHNNLILKTSKQTKCQTDQMKKWQNVVLKLIF